MLRANWVWALKLLGRYARDSRSLKATSVRGLKLQVYKALSYECRRYLLLDVREANLDGELDFGRQ